MRLQWLRPQTARALSVLRSRILSHVLAFIAPPDMKGQLVSWKQVCRPRGAGEPCSWPRSGCPLHVSPGPCPFPPPPRPPRLRSRGLRFDIRGAFSGGEWFSRTRAQPESLKGVRKQARKASGGRGQRRGWACGPCRGPASGSPRPLRHLLGCLVLRNCDKRK